MNLDLNLRVGEGKVREVCHVQWRLVGINLTPLSQERVEDSLHLALKVQETVEDKALYVVLAIQVSVEEHKMLLVLVRQADLEGKEVTLYVLSQVVNQDIREDKVMHVSQEVNPLDMVNVSAPPVANLLLIEDMNLGHVVNHRIVEDNREQDQVSPLAIENMGLEHVSLLIVVNKDLVPVKTP